MRRPSAIGATDRAPASTLEIAVAQMRRQTLNCGRQHVLVLNAVELVD